MSERPPLIVDRPQVGFYKTRIVRGGPWVGVRIWWDYPIDPETGETLDRSPVLKAERNGEPVNAPEIWNWCAGNPITEEQFRELRPVDAEKKVDFKNNDPVF